MIDQLDDRLEQATKLIERVADPVVLSKLHASAFEDTRTALELHCQMTSAYRKLEPLTVHRHALLQHAVTLACHGAIHLSASGRQNVEQSDKYKDFALSIHRERGMYGVTRSSMTERLKGDIELALSSTLKFKVNTDSEVVRSHYHSLLASSPLPEAVLSSLNAVIRQCSTATRVFNELMDEDKSAPEKDFESKLLICERFWADFSGLGSTIDRFNVAAAGGSDADDSGQ
ncbi:MAG: hypothetical protein JF606_08380 [Burkholderiales bacterium]|nr:hypothetical protein [Burkholderiales bacterium]